MLCCSQSVEEKDAASRSKKIEKSLKQDGDKSTKEVKLLLLGKHRKYAHNREPLLFIFYQLYDPCCVW